MAAWRWLVPLLPLLVSACGPAPYPPDATRDSGVTVHMGGSLNSFVGVSSGSRQLPVRLPVSGL